MEEISCFHRELKEGNDKDVYVETAPKGGCLPCYADSHCSPMVRVFLVGFSSAVFNVLAGLFLLIASSSYVLGLASGLEAL